MDKTAMKSLIEGLLLKGMGEALDLGRIGIAGERQFKQYERSLRSNFRQLIVDGCKLIDESSSGDNQSAS